MKTLLAAGILSLAIIVVPTQVATASTLTGPTSVCALTLHTPTTVVINQPSTRITASVTGCASFHFTALVDYDSPHTSLSTLELTDHDHTATGYIFEGKYKVTLNGASTATDASGHSIPITLSAPTVVAKGASRTRLGAVRRGRSVTLTAVATSYLAYIDDGHGGATDGYRPHRPWISLQRLVHGVWASTSNIVRAIRART